MYAVVDPQTNDTVRAYPTISDADLASSLERAADAAAAWGRGSALTDRAATLRRVAELHEERRDELCRIIAREMGKPIVQASGEIDICIAIYNFYAENAEEFLADEPIELTGADGTAVVRRSPLGVLLGIMPWNYPYYQVARFAAPNLMIGNTLLLKHAPQCPESAAALAAIFADAGFPAGAYENIFASNEQVEGIIADPRVAGVSLTGSERAGAAVAEIAGRHLKKVVLELGGSDPFIVLSSDDLDTTVEMGLWVRFYENAGQICNGAKRYIVADHLYDDFLAKMKKQLKQVRPGNPNDPETVLGPVSSVAAADRLADQLERAIAGGATVALGGKRDGAFFEPTILVDIDPSNAAAREEFFGPFAHVYRATSEADAIRIANDTPYGLGAYLFTTDPQQAERVADQIDAGMVYINVVGAEGPELPFGGIKRSGFGRELGRYGMDEFVNRKLIRTGA
jgi:succinate-semialdehyde dehydrogenase/glutarate-semialdehyde dehydrogenase